MTLTFRPAQIEDLDVLMQYMEEFHNFDHSEPFDASPARTAMEKVVTDKDTGRVWLIQQDGEIVGYTVLTLAYRLEYRGYYAFLDELYIRADNRGQGIGTAAIKFLKRTCKELGMDTLQLEVKQDNSRAAALYKKMGFEQQFRQLFTYSCATGE